MNTGHSEVERCSTVNIRVPLEKLRRNTEHFEFVNYSDATHEIDNETEKHRTNEGTKLEGGVVKFINKVFP